MAEMKTIRVPKPAYDTAKERKESENQTWAEYLTDTNRTGPDTNDVVSELTAQVNVDASDAMEEIEALKELVNDVESDVSELDQTTESINERAIMNRLDDLETHIDSRFDEVTRG